MQLCVSMFLFRKDQHLLSSVNCWYLVLNQIRRESRDHATLSDIYTSNVIIRLAQIIEDVIRLFKKVSETIPPPSLFTTTAVPLQRRFKYQDASFCLVRKVFPCLRHVICKFRVMHVVVGKFNLQKVQIVAGEKKTHSTA